MRREETSVWSRIGETLSAIGDSVAAFLSKLATSRVSDPEKSVAFTIGVIALCAKIAKADGIVSGHEMEAFEQVFHVPPEEHASVARVFNLAKQDVAGYEYYARQMARLFADKHQVLEDVIDSLFHIAKADHAIHERELGYLETVASIFGFDADDFRRIKARHLKPDKGDPYVILGIDPSAANDQVKRQYRKLVRENHPDVHIAGGMPEEMIDVATERLARINAAYDEIARERGL